MKSEWFETFFQGPAVEFWMRAIPPAVTLAEVDFLEKMLVPPSSTVEGPARLLDIPCGHGRHAVEFARRGHRVTGVDLSPKFLENARRNAELAGVRVEYRAGDMRAPDLPPESFDGAYCMGNSVGYLDRENALAFLSSISRALKPGSKFVIDTGVIAESILPTLRPQRWYRLGDILMFSECRYVAEHSRLDIDYTFQQGGREETRATCSFVMTVAGLRELLGGAGLDVVAMNGGVAGEPFQLGSPRLVITARKGT